MHCNQAKIKKTHAKCTATNPKVKDAHAKGVANKKKVKTHPVT